MAQISMQTFVARVGRRLNYLPPVAREIVTATMRELADVIAGGESLRVPGLGLFGTKRCAAMTRPHPTTKEPVEIEEHRVPMLRPSIALRRRVWPGLRSGRRMAGK